MNNSATLTNRILPWRIWVFVIAVGLIFGVFLLRIFDYQILQGEEYKSFVGTLHVILGNALDLDLGQARHIFVGHLPQQVLDVCETRRIGLVRLAYQP